MLLSAASSDISTNAAALAGTDSTLTEAQYTALADLLAVLAKRPDLLGPALALSGTAKDNFTRG